MKKLLCVLLSLIMILSLIPMAVFASDVIQSVVVLGIDEPVDGAPYDRFRLGLIPGSFIPSKPIRVLREFTRYRYKFVSMKSSEKNRFQNAFTVCNIGLDSVVSDMFGKSATLIIDYLLSDDTFNPEYCVSLLQRSLKKKADSVLQSIEGYKITKEQKLRMNTVRSHLTQIENFIKYLDDTIDSLVAPYETLITLMCTIPGNGDDMSLPGHEALMITNKNTKDAKIIAILRTKSL